MNPVRKETTDDRKRREYYENMLREVNAFPSKDDEKSRRSRALAEAVLGSKTHEPESKWRGLGRFSDKVILKRRTRDLVLEKD